MSRMSDQSAVGLFGGSFDPVHYGHLRLAEEARLSLGLAEVLWIPVGQAVHREIPLTAAAHRLAMVRQAVAKNPHFAVDVGEVESHEPSFTLMTLRRLRTVYGAQRPLVYLLGADAFLGLASWHRWRELFSLAHFAVATRPGVSLDVQQMSVALAQEFMQRKIENSIDLQATPAGRIFPFVLTPLAISATQLRTNLREHRSVRYLLPDSVLEYIRNHQLYS